MVKHALSSSPGITRVGFVNNSIFLKSSTEIVINRILIVINTNIVCRYLGSTTLFPTTGRYMAKGLDIRVLSELKRKAHRI
jgi:hypothetical protein